MIRRKSPSSLCNSIVYLVPFDDKKGYVEAYKYVFGSKLLLVNSFSDVLRLPFRSIVLIEDVHKYSISYFLRLDLRIFHVPRGGCTLKIGWRTDRRSRWYTWIRLWRRNGLIINSPFFADFFRYEERLKSYQQLLIAHEPLVDYWKESLSFRKSRNIINRVVLVALGDRSTSEHYRLVHSKLSPDWTVLNSVHPRVSIEIKSDIYDWSMVDLVIIDRSVSLVTFLEMVGIPYIVIEDINSSRDMAFDFQELYENTSPLDELDLRLSNDEYSKLKIDLTQTSLINILC